MKVVWLAKGREQSVKRFHPWIFSGAVHRMDDDIEEGDIVSVLDHEGSFLGTGLYQQGSICVRMLSYKQVPIDQKFWDAAIARCAALRLKHGLPRPGYTDAFRLVHGEGDMLPGLIVDVYRETAVVQCHNWGMHRQLLSIAQAIHKELSYIKKVYNKSKASLPKRFAGPDNEGFITGEGDLHTTMREHGHAFEVDFGGGQKTGFFLDQRENRFLLGTVSKNCRVLNAFSYSGGFTVYAMNGGAQLVHSVDVSPSAVELVENNLRLNGLGKVQHKSFAADVMEFLKHPEADYNVVVLDPPAFAKNVAKRHAAVKGYKRLNAMAMRHMKPGSLLFTFSCSQVVSTPLFEDTIRAAAIEAGKNMQILHRLTQGMDHPVNLHHPEGHYLKGLVLQAG